MLTQTLRRSVDGGLVTAPARRGGEYRLTSLGESLMGPLTSLTEWAEQHAEELAESGAGAVSGGPGPAMGD